MFSMSASGFLLSTSANLNLSTSTAVTFGVKKAGSTGPTRIRSMPRDRRDSSTAIAFCSIQARLIDKGKWFTSVPKASARALATRIAEYVSLHCPRSRRRGRPGGGEAMLGRGGSGVRIYDQVNMVGSK